MICKKKKCLVWLPDDAIASVILSAYCGEQHINLISVLQTKFK